MAPRAVSRSGQRIDAEAEYAAARAGLAELAFSGCTTVFDHHYVFPQGRTGIIEAEVQAARELGVRLVASRGSMDLGASDGGLPPDSLVEEPRRDPRGDRAPPRRAARGRPGSAHPARRGAVLAVLGHVRLMEESAALARRLGLQLHTHLAETVEEEAYCRELHGCSPVEYLERLGWLADDVWCAHCVHLSRDEVERFGATGMGSRTARRRTSGSARASPPCARCSMRAPASGSASTARRRTSGATCSSEVKQALLVARGCGGGEAMTAREALRLATRGGAEVLRRDDIGSLEPGKQADLAIWRDGRARARRGRRPRRRARPLGPAPGRPARRRRRGRRPRRRTRPSGRGRDRARPSGQARRFAV